MYDKSDLLVERARRLARLAHVPRWTVIPTIRQQSVAEHSFNVIWVSMVLVHHFNSMEDSQLTFDAYDMFDVMSTALIHDEAEAISGDIAAPYRRSKIGATIKKHESSRGYGKLAGMLEGDPVTDLVKLADCLEALLFLEQEKALGNKAIDNIWDDVVQSARRAWTRLTGEDLTPIPNDFTRFLDFFVFAHNPGFHSCLLEEDASDET